MKMLYKNTQGYYVLKLFNDIYPLYTETVCFAERFLYNYNRFVFYMQTKEKLPVENISVQEKKKVPVVLSYHIGACIFLFIMALYQ